MGPRTTRNPIIPSERRPDWLIYPPELLELIRSLRMPLGPWHFCAADTALALYQQLQSCLHRHLVPFAYRQDTEDWACFEKDQGDRVLLINENLGLAYEETGYFLDFANWLWAAEADAAEWVNDA